jgi:hypothetical protein
LKVRFGFVFFLNMTNKDILMLMTTIEPLNLHGKFWRRIHKLHNLEKIIGPQIEGHVIFTHIYYK